MAVSQTTTGVHPAWGWCSHDATHVVNSVFLENSPIHELSGKSFYHSNQPLREQFFQSLTLAWIGAPGWTTTLLVPATDVVQFVINCAYAWMLHFLNGWSACEYEWTGFFISVVTIIGIVALIRITKVSRIFVSQNHHVTDIFISLQYQRFGIGQERFRQLNCYPTPALSSSTAKQWIERTDSNDENESVEDVLCLLSTTSPVVILVAKQGNCLK